MANKWYVSLANKERQCTDCEQVKNFIFFNKDPKAIGGVTTQCKSCRNRKQKARKALRPFISQAKQHPNMTIYERFFLLSHPLPKRVTNNDHVKNIN